MQLNTRHIRILEAVVELYASSATPVSSAALVEKTRDLGVSAATIRNTMAELEESRLLQKPHKSAGRVPTETGMRIYLDLGSPAAALHWQDRKTLDSCHEESGSPFAKTLASKLSKLSGQLTMVAVPRFSGTRFKQIGMARCAPGKLLVWFVSPSGGVQETMVNQEFDIPGDDLSRILLILNDKLSNRTLPEVRSIIETELRGDRIRYDSHLRAAMEIGVRALPPPEYALFIDGTSSLARQPEFATGNTLHELLVAIEDREKLLELLDILLRERGVQVVLGSEHQLEPLSHLSCVGSSTQTAQTQTPVIGVLGPARMDYPRLIPVVGYASELLSIYWNKL